MIRENLMRKRMGRQTGFTLIELMIVIAIIGILAAVAIPNFLRARDRAQFSQCLESFTGLKVAQEMYITDRGSYVTQTSDLDLLAVYMIAGCTNPDGTDCQGRVALLIDRNCASAGDSPAGTWALDVGGTGDEFSYYLMGTSKDRTRCGICVGPGGYRPTSYTTSCMAGNFKVDCSDL